MALKLSKIVRTTTAVATRTRAFAMTRVTNDGKPLVFHVVAAILENCLYLNEKLAYGSDVAARLRATGNRVDADMVSANEAADIAAFAKHIVKSWDNVVDDDGQPVPYSIENAKDILTALGGEFDELKTFCADRMNFTEQALDSATVAKN